MLSKTEASFLTESLAAASSSPVRADGRPAFSFRPLNLTPRVSLQSNGSARCQLATASDNVQTDVIVGCKLEVEERNFESQGARIDCSVDFPPAALTALPSDPSQLYTTYLNMIFSPLGACDQLRISPTHSWTVYIDVLVVSAAAGNAMDVICLAVHGALCDLRIPKTLESGYKRSKLPGAVDAMDVDPAAGAASEIIEQTGIKGLLRGDRPLRKKDAANMGDFELQDTDAEQGARLANKEEIPVVVSINLVGESMFLDATLEEENISSNKLILAYTHSGKKLANVIQTGAKSEIGFEPLKAIIREGAKVAKDLSQHV